MSAADKMRGRRIWMTTEASSGVHVGARRRCPRETPDSARSASSRAVYNAETRYRPSRNDRKKTAASKIKRIRTHRLPVFSGFISLLQTKALFFIPYHPLRLPVKQKRRILFGIAESYRKSAPARAGRAEQAICVFYSSICIAISSSISTFALLQILFSCNHHVEKTVLHA